MSYSILTVRVLVWNLGLGVLISFPLVILPRSVTLLIVNVVQIFCRILLARLVEEHDGIYCFFGHIISTLKLDLSALLVAYRGAWECYLLAGW